MKILTTFSGKEYILEDDEAQNIIKIKSNASKGFLGLRCGSYVDTSAIESIGEIPLIAYYFGHERTKSGYRLSKDGTSYVDDDGNRKYITTFENVKYIADPKYKIILEAVLLEGDKLKQLT